MGPKVNLDTALRNSYEQISVALTTLEVADGEIKSLDLTLSIPINTGNVERVKEKMDSISKGIITAKIEKKPIEFNITFLPISAEKTDMKMTNEVKLSFEELKTKFEEVSTKGDKIRGEFEEAMNAFSVSQERVHKEERMAALTHKNDDNVSGRSSPSNFTSMAKWKPLDSKKPKQILQRHSSTSIFNKWRRQVEEFLASGTQRGMKLDPDLEWEQTLLLLEPSLASYLKAKMRLSEAGEHPDIFALIKKTITDDIQEARCCADLIDLRRGKEEGIAEFSLTSKRW